VVGEDGGEPVAVSGRSRVSTVPEGSAANAALVGANRVIASAPARASTSPAAWTAATRVENWGSAIAVSTTFLLASAFLPVPALRATVSESAGRVEAEAGAAGARAVTPAERARPREARANRLFMGLEGG
jgi:hypothetical protein